MKLNFSIFVIIILTSFLACNNSKKPKPDPKLPPKFAITAEPKFQHQGNLWFLNDKGDTLQSIKIEIADNEAKLEKGLMYRKSMGSDQGMLFIFVEERRQSFWMKNTPIPLDIIFVNANKQIVHIAENTEPYSLKGIPSFEYAQFVVEVNAGYCKQHGVRVGGLINYQVKQK